MKRKRFTKEQLIGVLKQAEAGAKTAQLCRQVGITQQTFWRWKAKYGGVKVSDARTPFSVVSLDNSRASLRTVPLGVVPFVHFLLEIQTRYVVNWGLETPALLCKNSFPPSSLICTCQYIFPSLRLV